MAKVVTSVQTTIAAGAALSDIADIRAGNVTMLLSPTGWDAANTTFQISSDGATFLDLHDADGHEVHVAMGAGRAMLVPPALLEPANYVRIRSGPAVHPVPQQADRAFTLVLA
jgi:hypothetical protein